MLLLTNDGEHDGTTKMNTTATIEVAAVASMVLVVVVVVVVVICQSMFFLCLVLSGPIIIQAD